MDKTKCNQLWRIRKETGVYPQEVTREEATVEGKKNELKPGYVSDMLTNDDNTQEKHYFKLDTYTEDDLENAKFEIEIEKLNRLNTIKNWITFWSVLSIISAVIIIILQLAR